MAFKQETLDTLNSYNMEWGIFENVKAFFHNMFYGIAGLFSPTIKEAMKETITPQEAAAYVLENGTEKEIEKLRNSMAKHSEKCEKKLTEYKQEIEKIMGDPKLSDEKKIDKLADVCKKAYAITGPDEIKPLELNLKNGQTIVIGSSQLDPALRNRNSGIDLVLKGVDGSSSERIPYVSANKNKISALIQSAGGLTNGNIEALPKIEKDIENTLILLSSTDEKDNKNVKDVIGLIQNTIDGYPDQKGLYEYLKNTCNIAPDSKGNPCIEIPYLVEKEGNSEEKRKEGNSKETKETRALRLNFALNKNGRIDMSLFTNSPEFVGKKSTEITQDGFKKVGDFNQGVHSSEKIVYTDQNGKKCYGEVIEYKGKNKEIFDFIDKEFRDNQRPVFASKEYLEEQAKVVLEDLKENFKEIGEFKDEKGKDVIQAIWSTAKKDGTIQDYYMEKHEGFYTATPVDCTDISNYVAIGTPLKFNLNEKGEINVLDGGFANFMKDINGADTPLTKSLSYNLQKEIANLKGDTLEIRTGFFKKEAFTINRDDEGNVLGVTHKDTDRHISKNNMQSFMAALKRPTVVFIDKAFNNNLAEETRLNDKYENSKIENDPIKRAVNRVLENKEHTLNIPKSEESIAARHFAETFKEKAANSKAMDEVIKDIVNKEESVAVTVIPEQKDSEKAPEISTDTVARTENGEIEVIASLNHDTGEITRNVNIEEVMNKIESIELNVVPVKPISPEDIGKIKQNPIIEEKKKDLDAKLSEAGNKSRENNEKAKENYSEEKKENIENNKKGNIVQ